jgi:hypothetical protein
LLQSLLECPHACLKFHVVRGPGQQHTDAPYALGLLRTRGHRPNRRTTKNRDELSPPHYFLSPKPSSQVKLSHSKRTADVAFGQKPKYSPRVDVFRF